MNNKFICAISFIVFSMQTYAQPTEVYVSVSGSDSNSGSINAPLRTIQKASNILTKGGNIYIRGGVYRETVNVDHANQTFSSFNEEDVIVTGLDKIDGWSEYRNGIYRANFSSFETEFTQVFVNGVYQQMARYPNQINNNMLSVDKESGYDSIEVFSGAGKDRIVNFTNMPEVRKNFWQGGYFRGISGHGWMNPHGEISSSEGSEIRVIPKLQEWSRNNSVVDGSGWGFIFHLNALDVEGEWYAKDGTLYFKPPSNIDPNNLEIEAQRREWAFRINNKNGIVIKGINVKAASLELIGSNSRIEKTSFRYIYPYFTREKYNAVFREQGGLYIRGNNNVFTDCYIAHSWGNGVSLESGYGNQFENCIFEDLGWNAQFTSSILTHGTNTTIRNSTFGSTGRFHIRFQNKTDILYNDLYDCMTLGQDAGCIESTSGGNYATELNLAGSEIAYNHIHDSTTLPTDNGRKQFVVALYLEDVENYTAHHNVIWNFKTNVKPDGTFAYLGPRRTTIEDVFYYNNTIFNCDYRIRAWNRDRMGGFVNVNFINNLYVNCDKDLESTNVLLGQLYHSSEIVASNPDEFFVNANLGKLNLKAGSSAIDAGEIISGITNNYIGAAPDIGAYEFGQKPWQAGAQIERPCFVDEQQACSSEPAEQSAFTYHTIPGLIEAEDFDLGASGSAYEDSTNSNLGGEYRLDAGVDIQETKDSSGEYNVGWIAAGEWLEYTLANVQSGMYDIDFRIAAQGLTEGNTISVVIDNQLVGEIKFRGTGGWQAWQTVTLNNVAVEGRENALLRLEFDGGSYNLNWLEFRKKQDVDEGIDIILPGDHVDQCNTTAQCKVIYGHEATDCKNSKSVFSVCMCGSVRCDEM